MNEHEKQKSEKRRKTRIVAIAGSLLVAAVLSVSITSAYISAQTKDKNNDFSPFTTTDTQISEPNGTEYTIDVSGTIKDKEITVTNTAGGQNKPVFVRVKLVIMGDEVDGVQQFVDIGAIYGELNDEWVKGRDGYYYYKYALKPNEKTTSVFKDGTIKISRYANSYSFQIDAIADTVQAISNNAVTTDVFKEDDLTKEFIEKAWGVDNIPDAVSAQFKS